VLTDFVEEIQIKSSGFTAEHGGAMGGVVNLITKSGTNLFRGTALFSVQGDALEGSRRPTLRINLTDSNAAEYITYPEDSTTRIEPGFALGGPLKSGRAWFFAAYQPTLMTSDRTVNAQTAANPSANVNSGTQKTREHFFAANQTSQLGANLRSRVAVHGNWRKQEGLLPSLNATDPAGSDYRKTSSFPNYLVTGQLDWTASSNLFFGVRAGYHVTDQHDSNVTEVPRFTWTTTNNVGFLDVPVSLQRPTGFTSVLSNTKVVNDRFSRASLQADGTYFGNLMGGHQVKFGLQLDATANEVDSGEAGHRVTLRWGGALSGQRGTYGYYSVRSNAVDPRRGFITEGDVSSDVLQFFVQDAWTLHDRLVINAGVRTEREKIPYYAPGTVVDGVTLPEFGIEFGFSDKIAPRLGASYDLKGDGRWKLSGSWGLSYDIFKLELPRGSFGGDKWLEYYYTLDTFDWPNLVANPACPPACPGRLLRTTDFRHISVGANAIEPDLKPMRTQEATVGLEHQLNDVMSVAVRYLHKQVDRAIEDTQTATLDADGNEIYIIANPGEGLAEPAFQDPFVRIPKPVRDYDSVEFAFNKRFRDNWLFSTSYVWSRLWGNYSGLSQSDENGRTSPNVGRLYDYPIMMFMDGGQPVYGRLATDRPHQLKAHFAYQFRFGTNVGVSQYVFSGLPVTRELGVFAGNNLPTQYLGRMSDGRTPTLSQTDLQIAHQLKLGGARALQLTFNVLNLFNQDTAISRFSTYQKINGPNPNEQLFYLGQQTLASLITSQNIEQDPRFLRDNGFQAPIEARFAVKFLF
jgi:hypothetical protein